MAGTARAQVDVVPRVGNFVRVANDRSVGRFVSADNGEAVVRFFKGPQADPFQDVTAPLSEIVHCVPLVNSRAFFVRQGVWQVGRIDSIPEDGETDFIIAMPNSVGEVLDPADFEVRWDRPVDDPFLQLEAGGLESPRLYDQRSTLLGGLERQRTTAQGAEGLLASSVELHAHQFDAVRTAGTSERCRYLLADEVGMGKTIEACALIRQLSSVENSTLIIVPEHLASQWRSELTGKFHLDESVDSIEIVPSEKPDLWPTDAPTLLVVDEAHHFTRTGGATVAARSRLSMMAEAAIHLLLLSATPVRSNEAGFLDMLAMLDSSTYDATDLDGFTQRVRQRDRLAGIARSLRAVDDQFDFSFLATQLEELFPTDEMLTELIAGARSAEEGEFDRAVERMRSHLSNVYRLDHRVLRSRRGSLDGGAFAVRGRVRGRPFTLEVDDPTEGLRFDLLEFVRSQLAVAMDEESLDQDAAAEIFAEIVGRCSSLPAALDPEVIPKPVMARLSTVFDDDQMEHLVESLSAIANRNEGLHDGLLRELSNLVAVRDVGRVVISSAFTESIEMASSLMVEKWGAHRMALHSLARSSSENVAAVSRWETDPTCSILFVDAGAEEGINLQAADLLVHLDLPWSTSRVEQRIGRCDRYDGDNRGAIPSVVASYGQLRYAEAWFEFEADSARVFDRSTSVLQYTLASIENRLILDVIEVGPEVLIESIESLRIELDQDEATIAAHDALDSSDVAAEVTALLEADANVEISDALLDWLAGVGCRAKQVRPGVVSLRSKGRPQVPRSLETTINKYSGVPLALSRQAAVRSEDELLRAGHPLVDAITQHLGVSDRGVCFAMQRHASTWPPVPVTRSDLLLSVDDDLIEAVVSGTALDLIREFCSELLPTQHESVFFLPDGQEADHPSIARPYDKSKGDKNLSSRSGLREQLVGLVDWASLCRNGEEHARSLVSARIDARSERTRAVAHVVERTIIELDQQRRRSSIGLRALAAEGDRVDVPALRQALMCHRIETVGAGVLFLCDSARLDSIV